MGKLKQPLKYNVHPSLARTPEILERIAQGHMVVVDHSLEASDLIIGPNCVRLSTETMNLLPIAERAVRQSTRKVMV